MWACVVALRGEHALGARDELDAALETAAATGLPTIVDLSQVELIDSSVLGALVTHHATRESGSVAVVAPEGSFADRVLQMVGIARLLPVLRDRDEALRAFE